ncbi:MAG TPA: SGNH/GDSL hydrolase family protein [Dongiaceae bacterium]|nr:SGNH/GDSL hydrolase family protein [Dongiaceae bacterium]
MRRSAALAGIAALGTIAGLAGCTGRPRRRAEPPQPPGRPVRIVALGDSLALGTGASAPRNGFIFRAYLRVLARRPGSRIDSYAIGGSTAADVLRLQVPRLAGTRADAVVICAGGNDVVHRVEPERFRATYARLLARVRALQPRAAIVCCGVPDVGASPLFTGFDGDAVTRLSRADDAAVRELARRAHASFADLFAAIERRGDANRYLSDDRFHPSDAGYEQLAEMLTPVLLRALAVRPT